MEKLTPDIALKQLILEKEAEYQAEGKLLKEHFYLTCESIKSFNLIKKVLKKAISSPGLSTNVVNAAIGLTTGFIAKKILTRKSGNPLSKLAGGILEMMVATNVTNNAEQIKAIAGIVLKKIINQYSDSEKT